MKTTFYTLVLLLVINFWSLPICAQNKLQVIVETDLGGDPDDQASLIRFLLYANDFDVRGIILSRNTNNLEISGLTNPSGATTTLELAYDYIDAYGECLSNLQTHDPSYPSVTSLKSMTIYGHADGGNAGKNYIIDVLKNTTGAIWYTNWGCNDGSQSSLDKALDAIQAGQVAGLNYNDVVNRLHYIELYLDNHVGSHRNNVKMFTETFYPNMDGGRWYHMWDDNTGMKSWITSNATKTFTNAYYTIEKEGDTPTFMHLIPNGMNVPGKPDWGSWSGRFGWNTSEFTGWWCNQRDLYNGTTNRNNTLKRWSISGTASKSEHIMNDFKARIFWAQTSTFTGANHHPVVIVNGSGGTDVLTINLSAGSSIALNTSGTSDPDGNNLSYKWDYYKEVSNYDNLSLSSSTGSSITVTAPSDFTVGKEAHIILHVNDDGSPALTRYKRIIIKAGSDFSQDYLKISKNNRFLVTGDEKPFFWMGDTGWELFHKLNLEETQHYLRNRAGKGFTVIQAVILAECDGLTKPTPDGFLPLIDNDPEKPNEEYFTHVNKVIDMAADYGLYMAVLPTWGSHAENKPSSNFENLHIFTPKNAYNYGKYLGNRYKDKWNVVWIVGGDRSPEGNEDIWKEMIRGLREGCENKQLVSYHINGRRSITEVPEIADLLDFYMMQSGHGNVATPNFKMIETDYNHKPVKPVIDGEPLYENIPFGFNPINGYTSDYEPRRAMYWSVFAGGFGVTYGNNSVWQMNKAGYPPVVSPRSSWEEAIDDPGSFQVRHLSDLMLSRPFLTRIPDNSIIKSDNYTEADYKVATRDGTPGKNDATYIMAYFPIIRGLQINTSFIGGKRIIAWLFDPRTGVAYKMGKFDNMGTFTPPKDSRFRKTMGGPDWVIVVDDAEKNYPAPGEKKR